MVTGNRGYAGFRLMTDPVPPDRVRLSANVGAMVRLHEQQANTLQRLHTLLVQLNEALDVKSE